MAKRLPHPRGIEVVGSAVIENAAGEILLVQSPKWRGKWVMPGGHIEPGETIAAAAVREAEEETGLPLQPVAIVSSGELINSPDFHRPTHFIYFDVWCKTSSQEVRLDGRELTAYRWVTPQDALRMDLGHSYDRTIRDYLKFNNRKTQTNTRGRFLVDGLRLLYHEGIVREVTKHPTLMRGHRPRNGREVTGMAKKRRKAAKRRKKGGRRRKR